MMKAIIFNNFGGPEELILEERPVPLPMENEVLIKIYAAGVNRPDIAQRKGRYPAPPGVSPDILGLEVAGVVADCGIAVIRWKKGDNICALLPGGGYAEYATVDGGQCFPLPQGWGFIEGASLPEAICTVWHNVFQRGRLQKGENVLVHGGSSGIGTTAIQLANIWGAKVFATAGSAPKCKACIELGAVACVNYKVADFEESFKSEGVDLILDMVGGNYMEKNIRLLKEEGRLVFINALKGNKLEIDAFTIMQKRIYITGSRLRSRSISFKSDLIEEIVRELMGVFETRQFRPVIFQTFPLQKAYLAHRMMETDTHIGKIILVNCEV